MMNRQNTTPIIANMLVLGNGFDLYHELPTKYGHFLDFIKVWNIFYDGYNKNCTELDTPYDNKKIHLDETKFTETNILNFINLFNKNDSEWVEKFNTIVGSNSWINYFISSSNYTDKGWVDFENEIENILLGFDHVVKEYNNKASIIVNYGEYDELINFTRYLSSSSYSNGRKFTIKESYINKRSYNNGSNSVSTFNNEDFLKDLKNELDDLIYSLNIYLYKFIENIDISNKTSKDILNLVNKEDSLQNISYVISFNYTDTFRNSYINEDCRDQVNIHFIHGELGTDCKNNNMVLGIKDDALENLDYVYFKKYFQRIQKKTGIEYKKWLSSSNMRYNIYVFGHSLDATDGDIFKDLIASKNTNSMTIFYRDQSSYEDYIINLLKIFEKDDVIDYISTGKIIFKELQPLNPNSK